MTRSAVAVVTDSTAYLPEGFAERSSVRVVPLHVLVEEDGGLDGVDFGPVELAAALAEHRPVTTSRPTPAELANAYREALTGADAVVSVHLSRDLSGTWEAARLAAEEVGADRVRVVDSRSTAMGLGFAVLAAAQAAAAGAGAAEVERIVTDTASRTRTLFCLQTIEYLRRGGRVGPAAALLGTALAVKPLLHVSGGKIVPLEKVRTTSRAVTRLVELAVEVAGEGPVGLAVHHLGAPERAAELANRLEERLPKAAGCLVSEVGAAVGAHTGVGVLGVVVLPGGLADTDPVES
ncbi:MAG TPA: DegV family protein [Pseudonocardiaceae bacterium]|nr:DegV family protein [Pseudonocardiaceae bacterium]